MEGGKFFFNTVKEGDSVLFATEDEQVIGISLHQDLWSREENISQKYISCFQESHNWVMAFYRATGQAHRPAPPVTTGNTNNTMKNQGQAGDNDRKHGMEEYIGADPITFDHALLFKRLQSFSLEWRLSDPFSSLVLIKLFY